MQTQANFRLNCLAASLLPGNPLPLAAMYGLGSKVKYGSQRSSRSRKSTVPGVGLGLRSQRATCRVDASWTRVVVSTLVERAGLWCRGARCRMVRCAGPGGGPAVRGASAVAAASYRREMSTVEGDTVEAIAWSGMLAFPRPKARRSVVQSDKHPKPYSTT